MAGICEAGIREAIVCKTHVCKAIRRETYLCTASIHEADVRTAGRFCESVSPSDFHISRGKCAAGLCTATAFGTLRINCKTVFCAATAAAEGRRGSRGCVAAAVRGASVIL